MSLKNFLKDKNKNDVFWKQQTQKKLFLKRCLVFLSIKTHKIAKQLKIDQKS